METFLADLFGSIIGIGIGVAFVIPLLILIFGSGFAGLVEILESILGLFYTPQAKSI